MKITYLKNPIILGILAAALTYLYLYWDAEQKYKKDPKSKRKPVSILTPGIIGAVVWFLASSYFERTENDNSNIETTITNVNSTQNIPQNISQNMNKNVNTNTNTNVDQIGGNLNNCKLNASESSINNGSYHLIGKNKVRLPSPDVFLDMVRF